MRALLLSLVLTSAAAHAFFLNETVDESKFMMSEAEEALAAELIPLKTLQRVVAVPVSRSDNQLRVAVADPQNIHGIDELRLATREPHLDEPGLELPAELERDLPEEVEDVQVQRRRV